MLLTIVWAFVTQGSAALLCQWKNPKEWQEEEAGKVCDLCDSITWHYFMSDVNRLAKG
jgi:hypothetical protein